MTQSDWLWGFHVAPLRSLEASSMGMEISEPLGQGEGAAGEAVSKAAMASIPRSNALQDGRRL